MIDKQELIERQKLFEVIRKNSPQEIINPNLKKDWDDFLRIFSLEKVKELKKEEYVLGLDNKNSFCYWVETKLNGLGDIHGATAFKFGIYYGEIDSDQTDKYRFTKKFDDLNNSPNGVFNNVNKALIDLLISGKNNDLDKIKDNLLSPMFKGKILFLYYPDKFLNIFANEHLIHFLNELDINYSEDLDEVDKRTLLVNFKNNDLIMKYWTNQEFSTFLYKFYKIPKKIPELKDDEQEQEEIVEKIGKISKGQIIAELKMVKPISEEKIEINGKAYKRDNKTIALLKILRNFKCQICETSILKKDNNMYVEASHITAKHKKGSEMPENILILCPNHHKEFDLGNREIISRNSNEVIFKLNGKEYKINLKID